MPILAPASSTVRQTDSLTGLRFFAAFHVFIFHAWAAESMSPAFRALEQRGGLAVTLFFVLSGFVLTITYGKNAKPIHLRSYAVARVARVYVVYALSLLVLLPMMIQRESGHYPGWFLAQNTALAFLLVQNWLPWTTPGPSMVAWTLCVEALFYVLFPFVLPRFIALGTKTLLAVGSVAWTLSILIFSTGWLSDGYAALHFPIFRLPEFVVGIVAGRLYVLGYLKDTVLREVLLYVSLLASILITQNSLSSMVLIGPVTGVFGVFVFALAGSNGPLASLFRSRWLLLLGASSYSMYLFHIGILTALHTVFSARHVPANGVKFAIVATIATVLTSILIYSFVEEPAREAIRRRWGKLPVPVEGLSP